MSGGSSSGSGGHSGGSSSGGSNSGGMSGGSSSGSGGSKSGSGGSSSGGSNSGGSTSGSGGTKSSGSSGSNGDQCDPHTGGSGSGGGSSSGGMSGGGMTGGSSSGGSSSGGSKSGSGGSSSGGMSGSGGTGGSNSGSGGSSSGGKSGSGGTGGSSSGGKSGSGGTGGSDSGSGGSSSGSGGTGGSDSGSGGSKSGSGGSSSGGKSGSGGTGGSDSGSGGSSSGSGGSSSGGKSGSGGSGGSSSGGSSGSGGSSSGGSSGSSGSTASSGSDGDACDPKDDPWVDCDPDDPDFPGFCETTIEAEDMELCGYKVEHNDNASGDELIKLSSRTGYARADFEGEDGTYDIEICYVDENDGEGFIDIFVNGKFVDCISLDENDDGNGVHNTTFSSFELTGVELSQGDVITLKGRQDGCEFARIDKIVIKNQDCDNEDPEPNPDAGMVCSDASVMIDVLANDSDADGDALTITAVDGQAISEGGSVTLASGAVVTLSAGKLVYDLSGDGDAYDDLLVGEEMTDSFSYTVSDGNGGEASSNVDVTVCGAESTVEMINDSLPAQATFTIQITDDLSFLVDVDSTDDRLDTDGFTMDAFCVDFGDLFLIDTPIVANVYGSVDPQPDATPDNVDILPDGVVPQEENLDLVNWILNQDFKNTDNGDGMGENYSGYEVQVAVWFFTNNINIDFDPSQVTPFEANVQEIIDLATANGEDFVAGVSDLTRVNGDVVAAEDQLVGVILDPVGTEESQQPFIVGVPFNELALDCLCA